MGVFRSLGKQWKLHRISRALAAPAPRRNQDLAAHARKRERALRQLFDLCESDRDLRGIMQAHHADRETLHGLYLQLSANGAAQWEGGHFVPVAALADGFTLSFLLENVGELPPGRICLLLLEYFERNEAGPVPLQVRGSVS